MVNILCFGDSNTYGSLPGGGRWPRDVRWTGRLQALLGKNYYVIEEGLGGRTTVWDDPTQPNLRGADLLPVCLQTHRPVDMLILMLGTNDCKTMYSAASGIIGDGIRWLLTQVRMHEARNQQPAVKVLLVSPILIDQEIDNCPFPEFDATSVQKAAELASVYERIAREQGCLFFNAASVAGPSPIDHIHMDAKGHEALANALCSVIQKEYNI